MIGTKNINNEAVFSYMAENEMTFNCTREVVALNDITAMIDTAYKYDCVILDIFAYPLDSSEFKKAIGYLRESYNGQVIVFAPSASYTDERIAICERFEFTNVIRDYLGTRVKAKLAQLIPPEKNKKQGTPKERNRSRTVVLPQPMPPVRATRRGRESLGMRGQFFLMMTYCTCEGKMLLMRTPAGKRVIWTGRRSELLSGLKTATA